MKFDAHQLISAYAYLGPFALSLFMTIINKNFRQAKENEKKNEEIYSFIWQRFIRWTGLKKPSKQEIHEEYDAMMRVKYLDSFALLDKRVDELLQILNRIYMDQYA